MSRSRVGTLRGRLVVHRAASSVDEVASPIFTALDAGGVALGFHADEVYDLLGAADRRGAVAATHVTFDLGTAELVDASVTRLTALGASVVQGPFTTYYDARQVVFADPEGILFRVSDTQGALTFWAPHADGGTSSHDVEVR